MTDPVTIAVSIAGGSLGGGLLGWWQAAGQRRTTRRGRARLIHEDLYRMQSTVTRIFCQRSSEREWGEEAWLLEPLASTEDQQDVLAHLRGWQFGVCAGALGWAAYLRNGYGTATPPSDEELETIYRRLAWGRAAVAEMRFSGFDYSVHDAKLVLGDRNCPNVDRAMPRIERSQAVSEAKNYRKLDDTGVRAAER